MVIYYLIFPILFLAIALKLAKRDFLLFVGFIFLLHIFLKIILFKAIPNIAFASGTFINITIVLIFLYFSILKSSILYTKFNIFFTAYLFFFFVYLAVIAIYNDHGVFDYIYHLRNYYFNFLLFIIYFSVKPNKIYRSEYYIIFLVIILFIQSALAILQFTFPDIAEYFTIREYSRHGQILQRFGTTFASQKLVTGTLFQMQNVSSFIMVNVIFILALSSFKLYKLDLRKYGLLILAVVAMLFTGVRAPFIGLLAGIGVIIWYKNKSIFAIVFIGLFLLITTLVQVLESDIAFALSSAGSGNIQDPFTRLLGAFAVFKTEYLVLTSVSRTYAFTPLIFGNPIFGSGPGIIFSDYSITDAFLTLWVVETGLVGLAFLIFPYFYILFQMKKSIHISFYRIALIILLVTLSQSITNEGLWTLFTNIQFFFIYMILFRINNEERAIIIDRNQLSP